MKLLRKLFGNRDRQLDPAEKTTPMPDSGSKSAESILATAQQLRESQGNWAAIEWLEQHAFEQGNDSRIACLLCKYYISEGAIEQAEEVLHIALDTSPDQQAYLLLAGELALLRKLPLLAESHYRKILNTAPLQGQALLGVAHALHEQERYTDELAWCTQVLAQFENKAAPLAIAIPEQVIASLHMQHALASYYVGQYAAALEKIAYCKTRWPEGCHTEKLEYASHFYLGHLEAAKVALDQLLQKNPSDPNLRYGLALWYLIQHQFEPGWSEYRYRLQHEPQFFRPLPFAEWRGEPLTGKAILVAAEQGLGDQIMFASCLPDLLQQQPAKVYLETQYRLAPSLQRAFPEITVIATEQDQSFEWLQALGHIDYYIHLGDLPAQFRQNLGAFSAQPVAYLKPPADQSQFWQTRLTACPGIKVGFSWKGGLEKTRRHIRSLELASFAPLFSIPGITWVSLQYGASAEALAQCPPLPDGSQMIFPEDVGKDIDELCAIVSNLDLVITVCNTTVHIAGALGVPCDVLTPRLPEWRYGLTDSMPWYKSVCLLRQEAEGVWSDVLLAAQQRLLAKFENR